MEETKKEETKKEETAKIEDAGEPIIAEARKAAEEIRLANAEKLKLLEREEKLLARQEAIRALGGGSPAGQKTEENPEVKKKKEAMEFFKGTTIEKAIEKYG